MTLVNNPVRPRLTVKRNLFLPKYLGTAAVVLSTLFLFIELPLYGLTDSLKEGIPELAGIYAARSVFFICASAIAVGIVHLNAVTKRRHSPFFPSFQPWSKLQTGLAIGALSVALLSVGLLLIQPVLFSLLAREDIFIEPISALFLFAAAAVLLFQVWRVKRHSFSHKRWLIVGLCGLAALFFVIAMEEVSWFQRVVSLETPEAFAFNKQGKFNLHNFATGTFEYAFYVGSFIYLTVLPFLYMTSLLPQRLWGLENLIGGSFTLCVGSLFVAYNYDMWNAFPIQISYFLMLFMLLSLYLLSHSKLERGMFALFAAMLLIVQIAFLNWGDHMLRLWDATEYKEFFIAYGFLLYTFEVGRNLNR